MVKLRKTEEGCVLPVLVIPRASRECVRGEHHGRLKVAVGAPPQKGKANKALRGLLAEQLGISRSRVQILSGHASREKEVLFEGVSPSALESIIG